MSSGSCEGRTWAYKEQAFIWHPDKPTGDLLHFQALQVVYKRLAGIPDPEDDEIRRMTVEPKISARIGDAMMQVRKINTGDAWQEELDAEIAEYLARNLDSKEIQDSMRQMKQYAEELENAAREARNLCYFFHKALEAQAKH